MVLFNFLWPDSVWLSCDVLLLLRDTMATTLALRLDLRFFPPAPTVPTAVSDWLPSLCSSVYISPLTLVLLMMALPEVPIRLPCILGVNELILPLGRSDCSDIKLVLLRREVLLALEMADTSLTSLSDDLADALSQLLY